jgi:hypothetical protein
MIKKVAPLTGAVIVVLFVVAAPVAATTRTVDPLVGTWDTGPVAASTLTNGLTADGYTSTQIKTLFQKFGIKGQFEWRLDFYRQGTKPFQLQVGWDPTGHPNAPGGGDHGPYQLLANHRFVVSGADPPTNRNRALWSYRLGGKMLHLRLVHLSEPAFSATAVVWDRMIDRAMAVAPFTKAG